MPHYHALAVAAWALVPLFAWADRAVGFAADPPYGYERWTF